MFGRVIVNKPELKFREFDTYRSYYCGLCKALKKEGVLSSLCLNYDTTFLALLLNSLYESKKCEKCSRCICHPFKPHNETSDDYSQYVAHMTIILAYYKCVDDFHDDKNIIKLLYSLYLKGKVKKIKLLYGEKCEKIQEHLHELNEVESLNMEEAANCFGKILGEVFTPNDDEWKDTLYSMGFYLGKFIYIADCYSDIEDDIKHNKPNPLKNLYNKPDFHSECDIILNMMAAECADEFEKLPIVENISILRNILYSGIWQNLKGEHK